MRKKPLEEIVVFEEDEFIEEEPEKENDIFVFDDEEEVGRDANSQGVKNLSEQAENEEPPTLSKKQFEDYVTKLENRVIFGNLKNLHYGVAKQPSYLKDARNKRRQSQQYLENQRRVDRSERERPSLYSEMPKNVRVDYLKQQKPSQLKQQKPSYRKENIEQSLNDQLPGCDMQGACLSSSKRSLQLEQQKQKSILKVSNFRQFLYTQLRSGYQLSLLLKRTQNGLLSTTYKCYFPQNGQFVMAIQKGALGSYVFSTSEVHISEEHISYLGKMEYDFMGKEFRFYDAGEDCGSTKIMEHYKKQMAFVGYAQDKDHPRRFNAFLSTCDNALTQFTVIDSKSENIIKDKWQKGQREHLCRLATRQPTLDQQDGSYKLDFQGLAGVPSTKNFILQNQKHCEALIFGRQDKDTYLMRMMCPFSILQAVAVSLSSVHYKFL